AAGALRSGAGLVTVATPQSCQPIVASLAPGDMHEGLDEEDGTVTAKAVDRVLALQQDIVVCGPGLGRTANARAFVHALVERAAVPLLLDADAIMAFVDIPDALLGQDGREVIITPHPGEMA